MPMIDDGFDFIFFHVFDQVRRWTLKVGAVGSGFSIGQKKGHVEDVVDSPR